MKHNNVITSFGVDNLGQFRHTWDRQERPSLGFIIYSSLVDIEQTLCH